MGAAFLFGYLNYLYIQNKQRIDDLLLMAGIIAAVMIGCIFYWKRYYKKNVYSETPKIRKVTIFIGFLNIFIICVSLFCAVVFEEKLETDQTVKLLENILAFMSLATVLLAVIAAKKTRAVSVPLLGLILSALLAFGYIPGFTDDASIRTYILFLGGLAGCILLLVLFVIKLRGRNRYRDAKDKIL